MLQSKIQGELDDALHATPDYSEAFTKKVQKLAAQVEAAISAPITHDSDMNYSAAQRIVVRLNGKHQAVASNEEQEAFRLLDFISSKGRFYTWIVLELCANPAASKLDSNLNAQQLPPLFFRPISKIPKQIALIQQKISAVLEKNKYTPLEGEVLAQVVEGQTTELDGKPATVFEVLFGETI